MKKFFQHIILSLRPRTPHSKCWAAGEAIPPVNDNPHGIASASPHFLRGLLAMTCFIFFFPTAALAFMNWGEIDRFVERKANSATEGLQFEDNQAVQDATEGSFFPNRISGGGKGFYLSIYEDTVRSPNRLVEEEIKTRFGIDFKVDVSPPHPSGQYLFLDFFKNFEKYPDKFALPRFKETLSSDCVRIKAAQADQEKRRWDLLKKRLQNKNDHQEKQKKPSEEIVNREVLLRLLNQIDEESYRRFQHALRQIPDFSTLQDQAILFSCYKDLQDEISFELELQSILNPSRKKLEALQTFMNGRLDDFTQDIAFMDIPYRTSFPRYDLIFDLSVIDFLIFGSSLSVDAASLSETEDPEVLRNQLKNARAIIVPSGFDPDTFSTGPLLSLPRSSIFPEPSVSRTSSSGNESSPLPGPPVGGFGTSSKESSGLLCPVDAPKGIKLQYLSEGGRSEDLEGLARDKIFEKSSSEEDDRPLVIRKTPPKSKDKKDQNALKETASLSSSGTSGLGPNRKAACQGTFSMNVANNFLDLHMCLDISFDKVGKTWKGKRDDTCLACQINSMNQVFEEKVLKNSIRPHKNTGTIMESAVCEEGYGDDIGFFSFIEWVPVKIYDEICYPEGGLTTKDYSEVIGYPELLNRVNRPGLEVQCDADFFEEKAIERCKEAIGEKTLTYEEVKEAYLATVDIKPKDLDELDEENIWVQLAGEQGVAERELHFFLYRLGKDQPRFEEDQKFPQDLKFRAEVLKKTLKNIQNDKTLKVDVVTDQKLEQLLCLKGYTFEEKRKRGEVPEDFKDVETSILSQLNCKKYPDTFSAFFAEVDAERSRVAKITGQWNKRSQDWNKEHQCGIFAGSGLIDAFSKGFEGVSFPDYLFETTRKKIQSPEEKLTGQVTSNKDLEDLNTLFAEIQKEVSVAAKAEEREQEKKNAEANQERSLLLYRAFAEELSVFKTHMRSLTDWWAAMVDQKQFVAKDGRKINAIDSFKEKLK